MPVQSPLFSSSRSEYDDQPVEWMVYPALFFLVCGLLMGFFISVNGFLLPDYFAGEYATFGRLRPVHVNTVALLWLLSADVGLLYFFVPRLCGISLWSSQVAAVSALLWWFSLIVGVGSFPWGTNFGWEYAELPMWVGPLPIKALFTIAWVLVVVNIAMTVATRRHAKMYVSLWYSMGTMVWTTFTVLVGFFAILLVPQGISRVNTSFFYVHNLVGLIFTPMGLAQLYYFLPKAANIPIYSHRLSMIGFWSIAFVYAWIGAHHIIHGPVSQWLQTVSIIFSIWLFIPVWTVVTNILATLKGRWDAYASSVSVRFLITGTMFYLMACVQGPLMALRNVNEITSKTDWVIGHSHVSLYATFTFFASAGIYYAIPVITKRPLWSERLASYHFSLSMIASAFFLLPLWIGGFWQGMLWSTWANGSNYLEYHRNLAQLSFLDTVAQMHPWWALRSFGGFLIVVANLLFAVNIFNTALLPQRSFQRVQ